MPAEDKFIEKELKLRASKERELPTELTTSGAINLVVGTVFYNKYQILSKIGSGGMSNVYKAKDMMLDKHVAVKMLKHHDDAIDEHVWYRFRQEAKSANKLSHPNIIRTYDFNITDDGRPFLVMELIEGQSIAQLIADPNPIEETRFLSLMIQVCEGLEHAHKNGIIHRDIKPSNIAILQVDGEERAIILDFGIAKLHTLDEPEATKLTQTGEVFGSPAYMSPEQAQAGPLDARSDIYSMGCLMYEMMCGSTPFRSETIFKTLMDHCNATPEPLSKSNQSINPAIEAIVMKCLEKDPAKRYQSAGELAKELSLVRGQAGVPAALQAVKRKNLIKFTIVALLVGLLAILALFANTIWSNPSTRSMTKIIAITEGWYRPWWMSDLDDARDKRLAARWDEAEQVLIRTIKKAEQMNLPADEIWNVYGSTAAFYRDRHRYDLGRDYYRKCLNQGDWPCTRAQQGYLALCEMELGDLDQAAKDAETAIEFWSGKGESKQKQEGLFSSLEVIGKIHYQIGMDWPQGNSERIKEFQKAQDAFTQLKSIASDAAEKSKSSWFLAKALLAQDNLVEGEASYNEAKNIRKEAFGDSDPGIKKLEEQFERLRTPPHTESMLNADSKDNARAAGED